MAIPFILIGVMMAWGMGMQNLIFTYASGSGEVEDPNEGVLHLTLDSTATGGAQARSIATFESQTVKRIDGRLLQGYVNWEYCDSTRPGDSMFVTVKTACVRGGAVTAKTMRADTLTGIGFINYNFTLDSSFRTDTWIDVQIVDSTNAAANCRPAAAEKTNYRVKAALQMVGEGR